MKSSTMSNDYMLHDTLYSVDDIPHSCLGYIQVREHKIGNFFFILFVAQKQMTNARNS